MSHPDPTRDYADDMSHPSNKPSPLFKSKRRHGLKMIDKKWAPLLKKGKEMASKMRILNEAKKPLFPSHKEYVKSRKKYTPREDIEREEGIKGNY